MRLHSQIPLTTLDVYMQTIVPLLKLQPTLIRGNASEIMAVAGAAGAATRGVDSTALPSDALASGKQLAKQYECIVGILGEDDLVSLFCTTLCGTVNSLCLLYHMLTGRQWFNQG